MTRQLARRSQPLHVRFGDAFVILSVTLLSLASGAWLITNLSFPLSSAMLASLASYCVLLLLHLLLRRFYAQTEEDDDAPTGADARWQSGLAAERFEAVLARSFNPAHPSTAGAGAQPPPPSQPGMWPEPLPMPPDTGHPPPREEASSPDPFAFRPTRSLYFEDDAEADPYSLGEPPRRAAGLDDPPLAPENPEETPEMNVEIIQDLIKKLADELNGGPPFRDQRPEEEASLDSEADTMIGHSVAALETTARTMRGGTADAPFGAGAGPTPAGGGSPPPPWRPPSLHAGRPGAPPMTDPQLARIAEAVAAERIEVFLEPIQGLSEGRARHYEVSIRLRTADGTALEQVDVARMAQGSSLMPRIDAARMMRAARVARRLGERGRKGSVLTAAAGQSLTDEKFRDTAALQPGTDGRISLVLSFTQSDVRGFTPVHTEAVGTMAAGGFGFALEDVTDLDMDFGGLKAMGFEFVKLDAQVFLEGLPTSEGRVPASDICRHLSDFGLSVIVGRIEDDWLLARILGFGVLLGTGTLFGGRKLVKAEVVRDRGSAAA